MDTKLMFSSESEEWETPAWLMSRLDERYGEFDLDPAATAANAKARNYFTKEQDGLRQVWRGNVFVNPPYGRGSTRKWVSKAVDEIIAGNAQQVVMLLPARTDTKWFREVMSYAYNVDFIQGRVTFEQKGTSGNPAPFPSIVVVFNQMWAVRKRPLMGTIGKDDEGD